MNRLLAIQDFRMKKAPLNERRAITNFGIEDFKKSFVATGKVMKPKDNEI